MFRRTSLLIITLLVLLIFLPGCWNAREINDLAFVLGIALDKTSDGNIKVTIQMARPDAYGKTPTGGGTQTQQPFWISTSTGKTFFEAIRNMAEFTSRRIFWSHIRLIIISDKLARSDYTEILDFFCRNPELRLRTWVAITPGDAEKILQKSVSPNMEKDTSSSLVMLIEKRFLTGRASGMMLKDFLEDYLNPYTYPVASKIAVDQNDGQPTLKLSGTAVFNKHKLVGWLDEKETRGLQWLKRHIRRAIIVVKCPFDGRPVSIEITGTKVKYQANVFNNQPEMAINIKATGNLTEQSCKTDFNDPKKLDALKKALASAIRSDIETTLRASQQKLGVDFVGLSEIYHHQNKKEWQELLAQKPKFFKDVKFNIGVKTAIPNEALFAKPLSFSDPAQSKKGRDNK